jgi:thymidine kinase
MNIKILKYSMNQGKMTSYVKSGYLEIILGPMFSGKTSRLVEIYKQCNFCNISVAVINHCIDNRYDDELLSTHDKIKIPCIKTEKLFDVWTDCINMEYDEEVADVPRMKEKIKVASSEVILINEGQFFPDLEDFVKRLLSHNKQVYICGLDGDFERKKFGQILDLVPLCDKIHKLTSLCSLCKNGNKGIFSMRLTSEKEQTVVGSDNYITVCRSCYDKR